VTLLIVAAIAFGLIALPWVVYPLAMWARSIGTSEPGDRAAEPTDRVCVVVATRDHPAAAVARVQNLRSLDYPPSLLRVVVAVDRKAPFPIEAYREALGLLADVVPGDDPGGKSANLNAGVRAAAGADVIVFADVGQEFSPEAIRRMVAALQDARFGGVAGRYTQAVDDAVMAWYARLEAVIRAGQARSHSVVSTSGSIYAIRASCWRELPAGLICDDLFTTLSIVRQGRRVGFCRDAVALDRRTFTREQQFARRVRTLTGLIQYSTLEPWALWPWSNPIWIHFVLHKVLRLLTPIPLAVGAIALLLWLALNAPEQLLSFAIGALLILLVAGLVAPDVLRRLASQLGWVLRLQLVPGAAILNGVRRRWAVWTPTPQGNDHHAGAGA
jgi:cellulose synthase/poly-beta-1,6-N-acetylglucosamine synthase-like glycosyltransferase